MSVSQELFNQYRESKMIEILQEIAKSPVGPLLAFKGGTALRLFWGLPRFSQDLDFTLLNQAKRKIIYETINKIATQLEYEITDKVIKFRTILFEFRFRWEGPNFRLKVEVSNPLAQDIEQGEIPVRVASIRGVPVSVLREERLVALKLCAFLEREAPRDLYDLWFILEKRLKVDWSYVLDRLKLKRKEDFFERAFKKIKEVSKRKLVTDVGPLLSIQQREWVKTNFLEDFAHLIRPFFSG